MDSQSVWYMQQMFNAMWILKDLREKKSVREAGEGKDREYAETQKEKLCCFQVTEPWHWVIANLWFKKIK